VRRLKVPAGLAELPLEVLPCLDELLLELSSHLDELLFQLADAPYGSTLELLDRACTSGAQTPLPRDPQALAVEVNLVVIVSRTVAKEGSNGNGPMGRPAHNHGAQRPTGLDGRYLHEGKAARAGCLSQPANRQVTSGDRPWLTGGHENEVYLYVNTLQQIFRSGDGGITWTMQSQNNAQGPDAKNHVALRCSDTIPQVGDRSGPTEVGQSLRVRIDADRAPLAQVSCGDLSHHHQAILRKTWKPAALSRNR